jgi:hypothetical protein
MSNTTDRRPTTRHTQYTAEAFREIAQNALDELIENCGTLEIKNLTAWTQELKRSVGQVSDRSEDHEIDRNPFTTALDSAE